MIQEVLALLEGKSEKDHLGFAAGDVGRQRPPGF